MLGTILGMQRLNPSPQEVHSEVEEKGMISTVYVRSTPTRITETPRRPGQPNSAQRKGVRIRELTLEMNLEVRLAFSR